MDNEKFDIGMIGLGVMGRNFALNMADHKFAVVGFDKDKNKVEALRREGTGKKVKGAKTLEDFLEALESPKIVMMLVPAGKPVDSVIKDVLPYMKNGDIIIDGGNSHFTDTEKRFKKLVKNGIYFLGVGISGGEEGARKGPSMMPGGSEEAYEKVKPIFESAAAKVDNKPCVVYLGPRSAGHYVKMVHNGIEYGIMQLISETYDVLKRGLGLNNDELADIYGKWNQGKLQSFLIEITSHIFKQKDDKTDKYLIDVILDAAKQKGTGQWTSQDSMELKIPVPNIDIAVGMRDLSAFREERVVASKILSGPIFQFDTPKNDFIVKLENAIFFAMITTYSQGMVLLKKASEEYKYNLKLSDIATIWRGGCIIRSGLLEDIRAAYDDLPDLPNLLVDPKFSRYLAENQNDIREVISAAVKMGIPIPGLSAALAYYDEYRSKKMPTNLVQAQRDFFGSHTYERVDEPGIFHTQWD